MPGQVAERLSDGLITVARSVLVDEGGARAGVPKAGHQLLQTRAGSGGEGPARMPEIVKVEVSLARFPARSGPYAVEVGSPELRTLGANEDKTLVPWLGEPLQMPPDLGYELGGERDSPTACL